MKHNKAIKFAPFGRRTLASSRRLWRRSVKKMNTIRLIIAPLLFAIFANVAFAGTEAVILQKVMDTDSKAIILRKNGEQHLIEYGVGVISIWRYEGKAVIIHSPGLFLGVGSSIILPGEDQKARIWDSEQLGTSTTGHALPADQGDLAIPDEITLFDSAGTPTAYIDMKEDMTIYLWNGHPVAYLTPASDSFSIYGFNGKHLGWFENGIIRDHKGFGVGFVKGAVSNVTLRQEPLKKLKKLSPLKSLEKLEPLKPLGKQKFSEIPLKVFLALGSKKDLQDIIEE